MFLLRPQAGRARCRHGRGRPERPHSHLWSLLEHDPEALADRLVGAEADVGKLDDSQSREVLHSSSGVERQWPVSDEVCKACVARVSPGR